MISAIIIILLGLVVWQLLPGWIRPSESARRFVNLACTIIGLLIVIGGAIDLIRAILS
ncbi:MAG: hypothetical protein K2L77_02295 [Muribaculaceae bacterium]|nr:hypothetical protein [Muribaculaceae bacterium]